MPAGAKGSASNKTRMRTQRKKLIARRSVAMNYKGAQSAASRYNAGAQRATSRAAFGATARAISSNARGRRAG